MKNSFLFVPIILIMALILGSVALAEDGNYDFKQFRWGDSEEYVESVEGIPYHEGETNAGHTIFYSKDAIGLDATLAYSFNDNGLSSTMYIFTEKHSNASKYIEDYEKIRKALKNKYGEPFADKEVWDNDDHKSYYSDKKGEALEFGFLTYALMYLMDRTEIYLWMDADNYIISTVLSYDSRVNPSVETDYSDDL